MKTHLPRRPQQGGAVLLIAILILMGVVGMVLSNTMFSGRTTAKASATNADSINALFVAEAGLQRAAEWLLPNGTSVASCGDYVTANPSGTTSNGGTFTYIKATDPTADNCSVRVQGVFGSTTRVIEGQFKLGSTTSSGTTLSVSQGNPFSDKAVGVYNTAWCAHKVQTDYDDKKTYKNAAWCDSSGNGSKAGCTSTSGNGSEDVGSLSGIKITEAGQDLDSDIFKLYDKDGKDSERGYASRAMFFKAKSGDDPKILGSFTDFSNGNDSKDDRTKGKFDSDDKSGGKFTVGKGHKWCSKSSGKPVTLVFVVSTHHHDKDAKIDSIEISGRVPYKANSKEYCEDDDDDCKNFKFDLRRKGEGQRISDNDNCDVKRHDDDEKMRVYSEIFYAKMPSDLDYFLERSDSYYEQFEFKIKGNKLKHSENRWAGGFYCLSGVDVDDDNANHGNPTDNGVNEGTQPKFTLQSWAEIVVTGK